MNLNFISTIPYASHLCLRMDSIDCCMEVNCFYSKKMAGHYIVNQFSYVLMSSPVNNKGKYSNEMQLKSVQQPLTCFPSVSPEANSEIRPQIQEVYLGGSFREHLKGRGKWDGTAEKAKKGIMVKQVTTLENWSLIPLGSCGRQYKTHTSEISHPKGERAGVSIHQFPLDIGWGLHSEDVNSLACLDYCMWVDRRDSVAREILERSQVLAVESQAVLSIHQCWGDVDTKSSCCFLQAKTITSPGDT